MRGEKRGPPWLTNICWCNPRRARKFCTARWRSSTRCASTLGPKSKCVLIEKKWGQPLVCNDGVTIAKEFELEDHEENLGAQVIRQAAERTGISWATERRRRR